MSKVMWAGIAALIFGSISGVLERTFYGYVDENNVLQESIFLPLAFILLFLGCGLVAIAMVRTLIGRFRKPRD
jgi:hypothetical protein